MTTDNEPGHIALLAAALLSVITIPLYYYVLLAGTTLLIVLGLIPFALTWVGFAGTVKREVLTSLFRPSIMGRTPRSDREPSLPPKTRSGKQGDTQDRYIAGCYRLLGKRLRRWQFDHLDEQLRQARLNYSPQAYIAVAVLTTLLATIAAFSLFTLLFVVLLDTSLLYPLVLAAITAGATAMFFVMIIQLKISSRKTNINQDLPFTLSELSILASTGLSPIEIIRRVARRSDDSAITEEFRRMLYKIEVEGKDLISAMSEAAQETPSLQLRETLWDISNMIHQGGDLDRNLREKADQTLQLKRDIQKEFIEKLMMYSEGYMSLVVVGVLFAGIGAFLLSALGSSMGGLGASTILFLLTYAVVPIAVIVTGVLLSMSYERSGYKS